MASLHQLLDEEGFHLKKAPSMSRKQVKLREEVLEPEQSVTSPTFICYDQSSFKLKADKASALKGPSLFSSSIRLSLVSETSNVTSMSRVDEPSIDEVAIKAVISILTGYVGRYMKDPIFRQIMREKCSSCLVRSGEESDNGVLESVEMGMESIDRLVDDRGTKMEVKMKSLSNSIQLLSIVASLNSKKSRNGSTSGIPNSHLSACAQFYLSIVYKLERNNRISARHLLQVFCDAPFLARTHLLPDLWEHFFLPHLLHLKIWFLQELDNFSNSQYFEQEKRMKSLTKVYNDQMDMGTTQFALYYKEWLKVGAKAPSVPNIPLPSRSSYAPLRRMSSDSSTSLSSNRNLYQAVFGPTVGHRLMAFGKSSVDLGSEEEKDKPKARRSSSSLSYTDSKYGTWHEAHKSHHFKLLSCQSMLSECLMNSNHMVRNGLTNNKENDNPSVSDLSRAISTICSSESLTECEIAVNVIAKVWLDSPSDSVTEGALSKAPVISGIVKVLVASKDDEILELSICILAELVSKIDACRLILLHADPQLEAFIRLLKTSSLFLKAAILLYLLKPQAKQMISSEWIPLVLRILEFGDRLQTLFTVRCTPQKAAMYFLDRLLTGFDEDRNLENASQLVFLGGLSLLSRNFEVGYPRERNKIAMLMCCCIQAEESSRNYLADNLNKHHLLELTVLWIQKKSRGYALTLLAELLCLTRTRTTEFLRELNTGWGGLSTLHIFVVYLQKASPEERPLVAAILLQLDLLGDAFRSSMYREEAVEEIIAALDHEASNSEVQEQTAKALLMLGGCCPSAGGSKAEEWLLQHTAFHEMLEGNMNEEEKATKEWQRKLAIALLNSGGNRFLSALSNSIANGSPNIAQASLVTVAWMSRVLFSESGETLEHDRSKQRVLSPFMQQHLRKSSECFTLLSTLDREVIDPLRNRP
ncbi:hypothetical protein K2173_000539 [Erythroxylum novogranatense]|uniref:E3 ubiquitin-protein ligase LIN n=1 Tax=Erythroxylum novogranatense TaxID=1862640 RepID=A0AAV8SWY1_9ROSI|nr:hypothetical protein K2173_000539 [Erythroxylum novogranatense]